MRPHPKRGSKWSCRWPILTLKDMMLSQSLPKSKIPYMVGGGGGERGASEPNFQLLMLSLNLLKSKIPFVESFPEFFSKFLSWFYNVKGCHFEYNMAPHTLCVHRRLIRLWTEVASPGQQNPKVGGPEENHVVTGQRSSANDIPEI